MGRRGVCSGRLPSPLPAGSVRGHKGSQKWRGGRITPVGAIQGLSLADGWVQVLFLQDKHFRFTVFPSASLWEQRALSVLLPPGENEDWGIAQKCGFLYFSAHYLFPKRICLFFLLLRKRTRFLYHSVFENRGQLRRWRPVKAPSRKHFPDTLRRTWSLWSFHFTAPSMGVKSLSDNLIVSFLINKSKEVFYHYLGKSGSSAFQKNTCPSDSWYHDLF